MKSYTFEVFTATPTQWHRPGKGDDGQRFKVPQDVDEQHRIKMAWLETFQQAPLFSGPLRLAITVFLRCPKATSKKKRRDPYFLPIGPPDWSNYVKQAEDALKGIAIRDDCLIVTGLGRKRYALDANGQDTPPRWVITLEVIEDGDNPDEEGRFAGAWSWEHADHPQRSWGGGVGEGSGVEEDGFTALPALSLDEE